MSDIPFFTEINQDAMADLLVSIAFSLFNITPHPVHRKMLAICAFLYELQQ